MGAPLSGILWFDQVVADGDDLVPRPALDGGVEADVAIVGVGFTGLWTAYHLVRAKDIPNVSPTNRKYSLFIKGWQRLPLPIANALGPWLARDLG